MKAKILSNIKDRRVRNVVRGVVQAQTIEEARKTLKNMRNIASAEDTYWAYDYLHENPLNKKFKLPEAFPFSVTNFSNIIYFQPVDFTRELAFHRNVFNRKY
jgi:hypothetical protein